jgi:hypothetical protein
MQEQTLGVDGRMALAAAHAFAAIAATDAASFAGSNRLAVDDDCMRARWPTGQASGPGGGAEHVSDHTAFLGTRPISVGGQENLHAGGARRLLTI